MELESADLFSFNVRRDLTLRGNIRDDMEAQLRLCC